MERPKMVESEDADISNKLCNPQHKSEIRFKCMKENILCCESCILEHSKHLNSVQSIISILQSHIPQFTNLKDKLGLLTKLGINTDELKSHIAMKLESAFDHLINELVTYKSTWITKIFGIIIQKLGIKTGLNTGEGVDNLNREIDAILEEINIYTKDSAPHIDVDQFLGLKKPEEFDSSIGGLMERANTWKQLEDIKIEMEFDSQAIDKMLRVSTEAYNGELLEKTYKGDLLTPGDYEFVVSQLPQELKVLKPIYDTARDGLSTELFHSKCDGLAPTLTVIREKNGRVFGGYTGIPWRQRGGSISDPSGESFLFTTRNRWVHPLKAGGIAIYNNKDFGPTFGSGFDLTCHGSQGSYSSFPTSYLLEQSQLHLDCLAGSPQFILDKYEVYLIQY